MDDPERPVARLRLSEIIRLRADLMEADEIIKSLRDENDDLKAEVVDLERQLTQRKPIPWLRETEPDRWEITDRD